jgi:molybdopterin-guanine dinucleotide biosynthesis protein A
VIVVLAADAPEPSMPTGVSVEFARDTIEDEGPLRGLSAGLERANAGWVVVAGGDMPDIQPLVLMEMLRAGLETGAAAVSLSDAGRERPLPCVLRSVPAAEAASVLLETGRRSLRDLLAAVTAVVIDEPTWTALDPQRRTLVDVDEPADLDR